MVVAKILQKQVVANAGHGYIGVTLLANNLHYLFKYTFVCSAAMILYTILLLKSLFSPIKLLINTLNIL